MSEEINEKQKTKMSELIDKEIISIVLDRIDKTREELFNLKDQIIKEQKINNPDSYTEIQITFLKPLMQPLLSSMANSLQKLVDKVEARRAKNKANEDTPQSI